MFSDFLSSRNTLPKVHGLRTGDGFSSFSQPHGYSLLTGVRGPNKKNVRAVIISEVSKFYHRAVKVVHTRTRHGCTRCNVSPHFLQFGVLEWWKSLMFLVYVEMGRYFRYVWNKTIVWLDNERTSWNTEFYPGSGLRI